MRLRLPTHHYLRLQKIDPTESTVTVVDLLNPSSPPLEVINVNLSRTGDTGYIIFSRLLPYEDFNAFSGMYAVFCRTKRSLITQTLQGHEKSESNQIENLSSVL